MRDALILYLLPAVLKPTGRPQLPTAEAQQNFLYFECDVRKLAVPKEKIPPRVIVVCKNITGSKAFEDITQIVLYMEGNYYIINTVLQAFEQMYKAYWVFGIPYSRANNNCLHFVMKFFFHMSYAYEKCSPSVTKLLKRLDN